MNRRQFVSSLAVAGAAVATRSRLLGADSPDARPKVGVIGCGWYGGVSLQSLLQNSDAEVLSLCDPNTHALETMRHAIPSSRSVGLRTFADYREMLASGHHDIVIVATPDHWHALPAIAAMQAGADVLLEKPISVDVIEGEALVAAARKHGRVVQVNTQRRSTRCLAEARDKYIRSGRLGPIGLVECYSYLTGRPAGVLPEAPVPAHLDFNLWTGPAPLLPFRAGDESRQWRAFMEYGNGQIGDLGVHMFDCARWMMGLGWPEAIESSGGIYVDKAATSNISDTQRSVFHYPGVDVSWEHRTWGLSPLPPRHWTDQWGVRFLGKNGTLNITLLGYEFRPADGGPREGFHMMSKTGDLQNLDFNQTGPTDDIQKWHIQDFLHARATRGRPVADIEEGHISTASCVLANLAQELGRPLRYDPHTRTIPGDAEATRRLARPYRAPWVHPEPDNV
ncbi:MAG TPA: Gfo/Idh/MocA family oxidoreductase [Lacunisphaera sp.]|nr:Gfo/Idh/MocA family oxidoreductase [Lacunisphaera sp.]